MNARAWREQLAPYAMPDSRRASLCLATSVVPYLGLSVAIYLLLGQSLLALLLGIPAAVFLVRSFIVFHDCTHGSFFASRRANAWLGRSIGLLLYSPFHALAPRPRRPPRDRGRPRPSRHRRPPHADRGGVPSAVGARKAGLPADAQPARHVRARPDRGDDHRPAHRRQSGAPADAAQRARHRRGACGDRRRCSSG